MKKIAILCGMALSLGMVACDDMLPNPPAQSNPDITEVFTDADLEVSQGIYGTTEPIVLADFVNEGVQVPVLDITKLDNMPAGYALSMPMIIGSDANFTKSIELSTETKDNVVYVSGQQLNDAIRSLVTKNPSELTINVRFPAYAINASSAGDATMELGGVDYYYATLEYLVKPLQNYVVDQAYYLVGNFCDWDVTKGIRLDPSNKDVDVYDYPVFANSFSVAADQLPFLWKIVPASAVEAGNWEGAWAPVAGDNAMSGLLNASPEAETGAGEITAAGEYVIQINAEDLTYQVLFAYDFLYVPGTATSLGFRSALKLTTSDYMNFSGVARLKDQWWMTSEQSLQKGTVFYQAPGEEARKETVDKQGIYIYTGTLTTDKETGLPLTVGKTEDGTSIDGLFYITANTAALTYRAVWMRSIGMVGDFNGWKTAEAIALTPDKKYTTWTAQGVQLTAGSFKFCSGDWAVSWGGSLDDLEQGGMDNNLEIPADGTYDVTLNFTAVPYTATLVKK